MSKPTDTMARELTPKQIVAELDKFIVGQEKAKRSVAVALRNRYRRRMMDEDLQDEVSPKNILMIGPTGVGKTEIARRLARLVQAPFIKVEATKFTEVGYVGRDVESMVRDLVETSIRMVKNERVEAVQDRAEEMANERLVEIIKPSPRTSRPFNNPFGALFGMSQPQSGSTDEDHAERERLTREREEVRAALARGELEDMLIEIEVDEQSPQMLEIFSGAGVEEMGINLQDLFGNMMPKRKKKRKVSVKDARRLLTQEEAQKLIDMDDVASEAIARAEESGIIFLDEIDKIAGKEGGGHGPDVSREGVQRDILPIVEGSTVMTKHGPVNTDHILFIAAGAFHIAKPSDLIPELQGRFPIRVELENLSSRDFLRILTEPKNALVKQYVALLATEGVELEFTDDALEEIARIAEEVNEQTENIGARRLHTIMERLLEDLSFEAPDRRGERVIVDRPYVQARLSQTVMDRDLSRYIL